MSMDPIETFTVGGLAVKIIPDPEPENPRECDNLGVMVCWHRRSNLGDPNLTWRRDAKGSVRWADPDDFHEWMKAQTGDDRVALIFPLSIYEHSGMTMWMGGRGDGPPGTNCPWDSGQVGYIYVTREAIKQCWGLKRNITAKHLKLAERSLKAEVEVYDQYLRGDVYGYVVEDDQGNDLDSCWGCYGLDYAKEEGKSQAEYELARQEAERQADREARDDA